MFNIAGLILNCLIAIGQLINLFILRKYKCINQTLIFLVNLLIILMDTIWLMYIIYWLYFNSNYLISMNKDVKVKFNYDLIIGFIV